MGLKDFLKKGVSQKSKDLAAEFKQGGIKQVVKSEAPNVAKGLVITAAVGAGVLAAATPVGQAIASKVIPKSLGGKIAAGVAAPIIVGAVAENPVKAAKAAGKTATGLVNFGGNVASFAEDPSLQGAKDIFKENPVITTLLGGAGVLAVGGGLGLAANTAATFLNTQATNQDTNQGLLGSSDADFLPPVTSQQMVAGSQVPVTAETQNLSTGSSSRRKKSKKVVEPMKINNRVQVVIQNKNYINPRSY